MRPSCYSKTRPQAALTSLQATHNENTGMRCLAAACPIARQQEMFGCNLWHNIFPYRLRTIWLTSMHRIFSALGIAVLLTPPAVAQDNGIATQADIRACDELVQRRASGQVLTIAETAKLLVCYGNSDEPLPTKPRRGYMTYQPPPDILGDTERFAAMALHGRDQ